MAKLPDHATVTVSIVPDTAGFKGFIQGELVDMRIQAGWMTLEKQIAITYRANARAMNASLARANRLALGLY